MAGAHWLQKAIAGDVGALEIPPGVNDAEAWRLAQRHSGLSYRQIAERVAAAFKLGVAEVSTSSPMARRLVPERLVRQHGIVPLRETDRQVVVATMNPLDFDAEQTIHFVSGRTPVFEIAPPDEILAAIDQFYHDDQNLERLLGRIEAASAESVILLHEESSPGVSAMESNAQPVITLTNHILQEATRRRASDVHIEPGPAGALVRFRVDGVLREFMTLPLSAMSRVISRLKIIGELDIADRRRPQDGRARIRVERQTFDLRISTIPVHDAEKAVVRIASSDRTFSLSDIDIPAYESARVQQLLGSRDGVVVVTGPTGSGKTTTLYAILRQLHNGERNISTVEDPVEYKMPGIAQIEVDARGGVSFASALRALLRQDPDVILVGEVRDAETAEIAVQAAGTGHLVLTTLHTNDAAGVLQRLSDLKVERAAIATSLRGVVGQRLVRRLCPHCAVPADGDSALAAKYGTRALRKAIGCERCQQSGYLGRLPIMEVLVMSPPLERLVTAGASTAEVQQAAVRGGMRPMLTVALERAAEGVTTLEEVERVFGAPAAQEEAAREPHVLVTDDDAVNRILAATVLKKQGFTVSQADNGQSALDALVVNPDISLIVLDLDMPVLNGWETLKRLKQSAATAGIPVIVLTGSTNPGDEARVIDEGAEDYIEKPLTPDRFMARVRAVLRRSGG